MVKEIQLTQGKIALVDDEDFANLSVFHWHAHIDKHGKWYARRQSYQRDRKQTTIYMHRQILGVDSTEDVDHKDGDSLDNRRSNLRPASKADNMHNQCIQMKSTSGFKGVSWDQKTSKWRVRIAINGKHLWLGLFNDKIEAAKIYNEAAAKLFGDFARLNVV